MMRGFTLIELMVVVVLIGLVAATLSVRLSATTAQARLRAAQIEIEQALRRARSQATLRRRPMWLTFEPGSTRFGLSDRVEELNWRSIEPVKIVSATIRDDSAPPPTRLLRLRVGPAGITLPWAIQVEVGSLRRVLWSNGLVGSLRRLDGVRLDDFRWDDEEVTCPPALSH